MKKLFDRLNYKRQCWLAVGIVLFGFILARLTGWSIASNVGWVLAGLMFIVHPIVPESAKWRYAGDENGQRLPYCRSRGDSGGPHYEVRRLRGRRQAWGCIWQGEHVSNAARSLAGILPGRKLHCFPRRHMYLKSF